MSDDRTFFSSHNIYTGTYKNFPNKSLGVASANATISSTVVDLSTTAGSSVARSRPRLLRLPNRWDGNIVLAWIWRDRFCRPDEVSRVG